MHRCFQILFEKILVLSLQIKITASPPRPPHRSIELTLGLTPQPPPQERKTDYPVGRPHDGTLLDGEMVVDKDPETGVLSRRCVRVWGGEGGQG